jgi:hypothetical protein
MAAAFGYSALAGDDKVSNQYEFMLSPYHRITDNLTGSGRIGYFDNPDDHSRTYFFSYPNLTYKLNPEIQLWGGLREIYTENENSADKFELRPLASVEKAWQPKTWYALADVEPFFRFDKDRLDPLRVRGGVGYVLNDRIRVEFIYTASFTRPSGSSSLEYTENAFRLNIRIALQRGLLDPLLNPNFNN